MFGATAAKADSLKATLKEWGRRKKKEGDSVVMKRARGTMTSSIFLIRPDLVLALIILCIAVM
jgi:hypothetical protein